MSDWVPVEAKGNWTVVEEPSFVDQGINFLKTTVQKVPGLLKGTAEVSANAADVEGGVFPQEELKKPQVVTDLKDTLTGAGEAALTLGSGTLSAITAPINKYIKTAQGVEEKEAQRISEEMAAGTTYQPQTKLGKEYAAILGKALGLPFEVVEDVLSKPSKQMIEQSVLGKLIAKAGGNPQLFGQLVDTVITFGGGGALLGELMRGPRVAGEGVNALARTVAAKNLEGSKGTVPFAIEPSAPETGAGFMRPVPVRPTTSGPVTTEGEVKTGGEAPVTKPFIEPGLMEGQSTAGLDIKQEVRQALPKSIEAMVQEQKKTAAGKTADKTIQKMEQVSSNPYEGPWEIVGEKIPSGEFDSIVKTHSTDITSLEGILSGENTGSLSTTGTLSKPKYLSRGSVGVILDGPVTKASNYDLMSRIGSTEIPTITKAKDLLEPAETPDRLSNELLVENGKPTGLVYDTTASLEEVTRLKELGKQYDLPVYEVNSEQYISKPASRLVDEYGRPYETTKPESSQSESLTEQKEIETPESKTPWKNSSYSRIVEEVPIEWLDQFKEFDRKVTPKYGPEDTTLAEVKADIAKNGIKEPLILTIGLEDGTALLSEGNTRLAAAKELGYKNLPVRILRYNKAYGTPIEMPGVDRLVAAHKHVNGDLAPSEVFDSFDQSKVKGSEANGKVQAKTEAEVEPETYTLASDEPVRLPSRGYMPRGEAGVIAVGSTKPGFYSKLEELVSMKMSGKMEAEQLKKMLKNNGATDAEIQSVLGELKGQVTKQQVLQEIEANKTELKDVVLGDEKASPRPRDLAQETYGRPFEELTETEQESLRNIPGVFSGNNAAKFSQYVEPGAVPGSYRELFVTALEPFKAELRKPTEEIITGSKGNWQDGHSAYSDIPNPVVRIRFNERDVNGKRILFVEEVQGPSGDTKWKVEIKPTQRYLDLLNSEFEKGLEQAKAAELEKERGKFGSKIFDSKKAAEEFAVQNGGTVERVVEGNQGKMPPALQQRIYDIGVKRVLSYAKENGFDGVAWTTGKMQADRYNLAKYIDTLTVRKSKANGYWFEGFKDGKTVIDDTYAEGNKIPDIVGKDLANKIINTPLSEGEVKTFSGLDLEVGGEGLKTLYDKTLPALFKKYGKEEVGELSISSGRAEKEPASGRVIGERLGIPAEDISTWWRELDQEIRDDLIKDYYNEAAKETVKIPYVSISSKTPSAYTLYSGVNPFELPKVAKGLAKSAKQIWDEQTAGTTVKLTARDLLDFFKEPERVMKREPASKESFKALAGAEEAKNAFIYRNFTEYERALKGIKKNSLEDKRVAQALDGQVDADGRPIAEQLTQNEKRAYDFLKANFESMITEFARRSAGSEEAYQKVLRLVASKKEKRVKIEELNEADKAAWTELDAKQKELRGSRKVSELTGEEKDQYNAWKQEKLDLLGREARSKLTEGEREAYDILSRKIKDYLPHLFEKDEMLKLFTDEINTLREKLAKSTNKSVITRTKNRLNELEAAVNKMQNGELVTFESLPSNVFFRFFSPRQGKQGYALSAMQAYETYLFGLGRKMFDEPAIKNIGKEYYGKMSPDMQEYSKALVNHYMGYDKKRPRLDQLAGTITSFEWMRTLGLNPRSALVNLSQRVNTMVYAGEKYAAKAEKMMWMEREKANQIFEESGIIREVPHVLTEGQTPKGLEAIKSITGFMFNLVELGNRKHAYLSGYLKGKDVGAKNGLEGPALEAFAKKEGMKTVHKTQFRYGSLGMPRATWSPMGRIALQFGSYPLKQAGFLYDLWKKDKVAFVKYLGYTMGGNLTLQQLFDTDMSNALGIGISLGEMAMVVKEVAEGDMNGAMRHVKQVIEPGAGLLPSGPGPAVSGLLNVAKAAGEGKALKQIGRELTPVMWDRLHQYQTAEKTGEDEYLVKNPDDHATYRLNKRQLIQRTLGPKTAKEGKQLRDQTAERNLEIERKQGIESVVDAYLSGDKEKFRSAVLANKEAVALVLKTPGSFDSLIENEKKRRMLTKQERQKPTSVQNIYKVMREGAQTN